MGHSRILTPTDISFLKGTLSPTLLAFSHHLYQSLWKHPLLTSASISDCRFSSSFATTIALCRPDRLWLTAHSQSRATTASSSGEICQESKGVNLLEGPA